MFNAQDATRVIEAVVVGGSVQACVPYKGDFLIRVKFASPDEADYDPFFLVKSDTGEVQEFSIMTDGDPEEVMAAFDKAGLGGEK